MNYINLPSKLIDVSVEVESYRFLNMVAEIGGAFAGFYLAQDHHQGKIWKFGIGIPRTPIIKKILDIVGDILGQGDNSTLTSRAMAEVIETVTSLEHSAVKELFPDHPEPGSKQTSGVALDPNILATSRKLSHKENLVSVQI